MKLTLKVVIAMAALTAGLSHAHTPASVPYMPSLQARHYLHLLADYAGLSLPLTHWPLPAAAVEQALANLSPDLDSAVVDLEEARIHVLRELQQRQQQSSLAVQFRQRAEGLPGFDENYTPGSSLQIVSQEKRLDVNGVSVAGRLGLRVEQTSNSLAVNSSGFGTDGAYQARLDGSAAVLSLLGWNFQAFSHRYWWGPGWQSSLINGSNAPAWNGIGFQRGEVSPSQSPWLSWMGPWNLEVFVAQAQDPLVTVDQPQAYLFSGGRMTLKPLSWLELGLSRGLQTGGAGRPSGITDFAKAFFGQQVNRNPGDPPDSSNQIAGYDARIRCPLTWGRCAVYTQWMGEDAVGSVFPTPYKFMSLWGVEQTYGQGRYRVFAEYANTNSYSLPWDNKPQFPGYTNGVYSQGYTNGGRWIGSAQGGGSEVTTLGWIDAETQRTVKLHVGTILFSPGAGYPSSDAPHGRLRAISTSQVLSWQGLYWTPELYWAKLSDGQDIGANKRNNLRLGLTVRMPF